MTGLVDWAASHARMVIAFIVMSLLAGAYAYVSLPKEGEPDIEIPAIFVSVPFQGISAEDSESLLVKPMETELSDLDGLKKMTSTAAEGYAGVALEFEFGWDKTKTLADVRAAMNAAEGKFPAGADKYIISEINFSEFPIIIVSLTGDLPERILLRLAKTLQDRLEGLEPVLEAPISGERDEMLEITIDPLRLESYDLTAAEMIADPEQQPANRGRRDGIRQWHLLGQDSGHLQIGQGPVQPADQDQRRPDRQPQRRGRYPPDL